MKPVEIQNLDQHLKPLQVDGVSTGIEISTKALRFTGGTLEVENVISKNTQHEGDLTVNGDMYLNDTNGPTVFRDNDKSVQCIKNRLLIFPSTERHSGSSHTEGDDLRMVVNFNYF